MGRWGAPGDVVLQATVVKLWLECARCRRMRLRPTDDSDTVDQAVVLWGQSAQVVALQATRLQRVLVFRVILFADFPAIFLVENERQEPMRLLDTHVAESSPVTMEVARLREMLHGEVRKLVCHLLDDPEGAQLNTSCDA